MAEFHPASPLVEGKAQASCRACVIMPARNEEASIPKALDALAGQVDVLKRPLPPESFEILLLLNNCTDGSAAVARQWKTAHPEIALHIAERTFPPKQDHVGTARRLLMDTAWQRLDHRDRCATGILSTDSDTSVAPDWIAQNLRALELGADAVGGAIQWKQGELKSLPAGAQRAYKRDRRYQRLVAELEDLLDPQAGDPWPRHLEHFGASLACTPQAYARAGGMPAIQPLEDLAFVDALRRVDARLRHEPAVVVYTSSRLDGRVQIGLSNQLRLWQQMSEDGTEHRVSSSAWLMHRFRTLRGLRKLCIQCEQPDLSAYPAAWHDRLLTAKSRRETVGRFLGEIDCDRLIEEMFCDVRSGAIVRVNRNLVSAISRLKCIAPIHLDDSRRNVHAPQCATPAVQAMHRVPDPQ